MARTDETRKEPQGFAEFLAREHWQSCFGFRMRLGTYGEGFKGDDPMFILSNRFEKALCLACELHRFQKRKNLPTPFLSHILSVVSLVCENVELVVDGMPPSSGFLEGALPVSDEEKTRSRLCEDYAIMAALHDAVEDQGGRETLEKIASQFGQRIADGVLMLSDCVPEKGQEKPPKAQRNAAYRRKMEVADPAVVLISCCDKIHNLRSIVGDYLNSGVDIWTAYSQSPEKTVENYERLYELYKKRLPNHRVIVLYRCALDDVRAIMPM